MGQSESKDQPKSPSTSAASTPTQLSRREREKDGAQSRQGPSNGQNVPSSARKAHSHVTKSHSSTPPTATLVPSSSTASTSTSNAYAQATVSASPASSHSRARSITTSAQNAQREIDDFHTMGNTESRESRERRPPSRSSTLPPPARTEKPAASPSSHPVKVPQPSHHDGYDEKDELMNSPLYALPGSDFNRPPRLPLPIERDPEPVSPIVPPNDVSTPTEQIDEDDMVHRRASMLSSTTLDDDEVADIETFALDTDPFAQKVLTTLDFRGEGRTVFVTGTFAKWEKKFRMQRTPDVDQNGRTLFNLTAPLPTGTHHIKFLVDGEMVISNEYPTTVDFTNSLVNYIEIAPPIPFPAETQPAAPAEPMQIPGAGSPSPQTTATGEPLARPLEDRTRVSETGDELSSTLQETLAPTPAVDIPEHAIETGSPEQYRQQRAEQQHNLQPKLPKPKIPQAKYSSEIPDILLHLDLCNNPEDDRYLRASKAIQHLPQPPSLPMFMSKSILNATTPHKDDASVLTMPNHTVLNHLATSSIRQGVLATSGTTRYKRKFLTTIMYKPTSEESG